MPRVSHYFFRSAIVFLIIGIIVGLQMSISGTHNVTGAHAHANLLGWVTMALFGGYYALNPTKAQGRLPLIQFGVYTSGVVIMIPALYLMLAGDPRYEPVVAVGSLIAFLGILIFAVIVFMPEKRYPTVGAASAAAE